MPRKTADQTIHSAKFMMPTDASIALNSSIMQMCAEILVVSRVAMIRNGPTKPFEKNWKMTDSNIWDAMMTLTV
jgi:hypothetical protein